MQNFHKRWSFVMLTSILRGVSAQGIPVDKETSNHNKDSQAHLDGSPLQEYEILPNSVLLPRRMDDGTPSKCVDNEDYRSPQQTPCSGYKAFNCLNFMAIGFSEVEVYHLVNNCPVTCKVPCGSITITPSAAPSTSPSLSAIPSNEPTSIPSAAPSLSPSVTPTATPSSVPSSTPSLVPSTIPTDVPSQQPSAIPSESTVPSNAPTRPVLVNQLTGTRSAQKQPERSVKVAVIFAICMGLLLAFALPLLFFLFRRKSGKDLSDGNDSSRDQSESPVGNVRGFMVVPNENSIELMPPIERMPTLEQMPAIEQKTSVEIMPLELEEKIEKSIGVLRHRLE